MLAKLNGGVLCMHTLVTRIQHVIRIDLNSYACNVFHLHFVCYLPQHLFSLFSALGPGSSANITTTSSGFDITSNTELGADACRAILTEVARSVIEDLQLEISEL